MPLLPLDQLGARETSPAVIDFGIFLPGISSDDDYELFVRVIHEGDQFIQAVKTVDVPMLHRDDADYDDYWSGQLDISAIDPAATPGLEQSSNWGSTGRYVYRYVLRHPGMDEIDYIIDPLAREYGVGDLSAITVGYEPYTFSANEATYKTPALKDAIVYELMIAEFGGDIENTIGLLDYLKDLGVTVIEVMPVSNVRARINWGYDPIGYFGVDERFGKRSNFQQLVDQAHQRGIAVVVDVVYGHVDSAFPYASLYWRLGGVVPHPFIDPNRGGDYGPKLDFNQPLTRDFYFTANIFWLKRFHVDGFRFDAVQDYWDGMTGYPQLVQDTYDHVLAQGAAAADYQRFFPGDGGELRLMQIAEALGDPPGVLYNTVSNSTWQNRTFDAAKSCAVGAPGALADLGFRLGLKDFPWVVTTGGRTITKPALQYIETHDHERFICNFGTVFKDNRRDDLLREGDRANKWYKVQPYLIGILTAKGIPFLWQGQEICQNYYIPEDVRAYGRILLFRPVDFNYFYDDIGRRLITLVRKLTRIRQAGAHFRSDNHSFFNDYDRYVSQGLLLFRRELGNTYSLVALNFTDANKSTTFDFPYAGNYQEELHGIRNLADVVAHAQTAIDVPSNYGCIWTINRP